MNTLPTFSVNDSPDRSFPHSINLGQVALHLTVFMAAADFLHNVIGKLCRSVFGSISRPVLFNHISHVVGLRTKEQMFWINTLWNVTAMKNLHASRNWAKSLLVRKAMSTNIHATARTYLPVAKTIIRATHPQNTAIAILGGKMFAKYSYKRFVAAIAISSHVFFMLSLAKIGAKLRNVSTAITNAHPLAVSPAKTSERQHNAATKPYPGKVFKSVAVSNRIGINHERVTSVSGQSRMRCYKHLVGSLILTRGIEKHQHIIAALYAMEGP